VAFGKRLASGIDLGGFSVKVVVVDARKGNARLVAVDSEPVERGESAEPALAAQAAALDTILSRIGLRGRSLGRVAIAVGGDELTVRQVSLPNLSDQELAAAIPHETRRHVPLPPDTEIAYSYQVLSRDAAKGSLELLLGACPKALVRDTVRAVEKAGVSPEVVDAAPLAGLNAILHARVEREEDEVGFLDVGGAASTLTLFRTGGFLLSRRIPVGGDTMTAEIGAKRKMAAAEAEELKRGGPMAHDDALLRLVETSVGRLAAEVKDSIAFFDAKAGRRGLKRLALGGGGARIAGLAAALERALGVSVVGVDPAPAFARPETLSPALASRVGDHLSELSVAFGLTRWWEA